MRARQGLGGETSSFKLQTSRKLHRRSIKLQIPGLREISNSKLQDPNKDEAPFASKGFLARMPVAQLVSIRITIRITIKRMRKRKRQRQRQRMHFASITESDQMEPSPLTNGRGRTSRTSKP